MYNWVPLNYVLVHLNIKVRQTSAMSVTRVEIWFNICIDQRDVIEIQSNIYCCEHSFDACDHMNNIRQFLHDFLQP